MFAIGICGPVLIYFGKRLIDWYIERSIQNYIKNAERVSEKEFEIIGQSWELLQEAYQYVSSLVSVVQSIPQISGYPRNEQKEILEPLKIFDSDKEKILNASNPQEKYEDALIRYKAFDSRDKIATFNSFLGRNSLYITEELKDLFYSASKELQGATLSYQYGSESKDFKLRMKGYETVSKKVKEILDKIEEKAKNRIHFSPWYWNSGDI